MSTETIVVESVTQYGPRSGGKNIYLGKKSNLKPTDFIVGNSYKVDVWESPKGAKYINKVLGSDGVADSQQTPVTKPPSAVVNKTKVAYGREMSSYEIEKDIRIHVSGILQAVIQCPAMAIVPLDSLMSEVEKKTREMLDLANKIVAEKVGK